MKRSMYQPYNETEECRKAMAVVERFFTCDIQTADAAYDVLVEHGVDPGYASGFAEGMYPLENSWASIDAGDIFL